MRAICNSTCHGLFTNKSSHLSKRQTLPATRRGRTSSGDDSAVWIPLNRPESTWSGLRRELTTYRAVPRVRRLLCAPWIPPDCIAQNCTTTDRRKQLVEKLPSTRYSQPLPLSSFLSLFCPSFFSQPIAPFQSSFYPVRFSYFLCPSSSHAGSLHLPRRSAFFRTIFPRFLLLLFRELRLATRSESFEIIAVTNDTVVNWNRLRNSIALWRGRGNEWKEEGAKERRIGKGDDGDGDDEHGTGRGERNAVYFAFYSRVPDSLESGALVTVVNCCLDRAMAVASPLRTLHGVLHRTRTKEDHAIGTCSSSGTRSTSREFGRR